MTVRISRNVETPCCFKYNKHEFLVAYLNKTVIICTQSPFTPNLHPPPYFGWVDFCHTHTPIHLVLVHRLHLQISGWKRAFTFGTQSFCMAANGCVSSTYIGIYPAASSQHLLFTFGTYVSDLWCMSIYSVCEGGWFHRFIYERLSGTSWKAVGPTTVDALALHRQHRIRGFLPQP